MIFREDQKLRSPTKEDLEKHPYLKKTTETHCLMCDFHYVQTIEWKIERFRSFVAKAPYPGCPRCAYKMGLL